MLLVASKRSSLSWVNRELNRRPFAVQLKVSSSVELPGRKYPKEVTPYLVPTPVSHALRSLGGSALARLAPRTPWRPSPHSRPS